MTQDPGPRPDVLAERIEGLGRRFTGVEQRLNGLATKDELVALIQSRDLLTTQQFNALMDDVKNLTAALATERAERMAADASEKTDRETGDKANEERVSRSRTLALSAIGLVVSVVLGLLVLINQIGGAPT